MADEEQLEEEEGPAGFIITASGEFIFPIPPGYNIMGDEGVDTGSHQVPNPTLSEGGSIADITFVAPEPDEGVLDCFGAIQ